MSINHSKIYKNALNNNIYSYLSILTNLKYVILVKQCNEHKNKL